MGLFGLFKKKEEKKPVYTAPLPKVQDIKPSGPVLMSRMFKVAGVTYRCALDKTESRQDVLAGMSDGDRLDTEIGSYRGTPSIMLIDPDSGLDIGFVPENITAEIFAKTNDPTIEAYAVDVSCFYPDDKDEEIYYCKARLFVLKG